MKISSSTLNFHNTLHLQKRGMDGISFSFESSSFKKTQLLPDLIRQPMADQGLIGYRFDRGRFSNGANLERIHFDGDILKFSFPLLGKDILQKLIV